MLNKEQRGIIAHYANTETVKMISERLGKNYFAIYSYMKRHELTMLTHSEYWFRFMKANYLKYSKPQLRKITGLTQPTFDKYYKLLS